MPGSFLCSRTKQPNEDDLGKLKRVLKYLFGTLHMELCLTAENPDTLTWCVDASYAVHWDSRSHTGMVMSLGLGTAISGSWHQKLNTGSLHPATHFLHCVVLWVADAPPNASQSWHCFFCLPILCLQEMGLSS